MHRLEPPSPANGLIELISALEQALIAESDALRARDVTRLEQAVAAKRQALHALGRVPKSTFESGDGLTSAATALLSRCRELNEIAGGAIAALRRDTSHALGLLGIESEGPAYGAPTGGPRAGREIAVG